jgi:hypothetical protein
MASYEHSDSVETTCAVRAYRFFINSGLTHFEACDQLENKISSILKPNLKKQIFFKAVGYLRMEPNLNQWYKYPLVGGCKRP